MTSSCKWKNQTSLICGRIPELAGPSELQHDCAKVIRLPSTTAVEPHTRIDGLRCAQTCIRSPPSMFAFCVRRHATSDPAQRRSSRGRSTGPVITPADVKCIAHVTHVASSTVLQAPTAHAQSHTHTDRLRNASKASSQDRAVVHSSCPRVIQTSTRIHLWWRKPMPSQLPSEGLSSGGVPPRDSLR